MHTSSPSRLSSSWGQIPLSILAVAALAWNVPAHAQDEPGGSFQSEDFSFFPYGEFSTLLPEAFAGSSVFVELGSEAYYTGYVWRRAAEVAPNGTIEVIVECPFVGVGWLRVRDPAAAPNTAPLVEHRVRCGSADDAAGPGPELLSMTAAAAMATTSVPSLPSDVPGQADFQDWTRHQQTISSTTLSRKSGETRVTSVDRIIDSRVTVTNGQSCTSSDQSGQQCCEFTPGSIPFGPACSAGPACTPISQHSVVCSAAAASTPITDYRQTDSGSSSSTSHREGNNFFNHLNDFVEDATSTSTYQSEFVVSWIFPGLAGGVAIPFVESTGLPLQGAPFLSLSGGAEGAPMKMVELPAAEALPEIVSGPSGGCLPGAPQPAQVRWLLPGPTSGNGATLRLVPDATCTSSLSSTTTTSPGNFRTQTSTTTVGGVAARFRATATNPPFALIPVESILAPRWQARTQDPDALGTTRTIVRPTLTNVEPGTYQVEVRIDAFDAGAAGHRHEPVPTEVFGTFEGLEVTPLPGQKPTISCEIEVGPLRNGSCELVYEAAEVSGTAALVGTTQLGGLSQEATADLGVKVAGLVDLRGQLGSGLGGLLRGADVAHPDAEAFYTTAATAAAVRAMMENHLEFTKDPLLYPEGLAILLNDCSLRLGGVFDIRADWLPPHASHRHGHSVDVNRRVVDRRNLAQLAPLIDNGRDAIERSCRFAGGRIVNEAPIHCEFD